MTYQAIVGRVQTRPHPNADRIKLGLIYGYQVVVDVNTQDGELMLFFPTDGQLSAQFAEANNLIRRTDPQTGKPVGGFFEENRRVRCQKFRGQNSDGFAAPLSYLAFTGGDITTIREGLTLDMFHGVPLCNKYVTKATAVAQTVRDKKEKRAYQATCPMLKRHFDTQQYRFNSQRIPDGALLTITEKLHGTSERLGNVLVDRYTERKWPLSKLGFKPKVSRHWEDVVGTRNVALIPGKVDAFYGGDAGFRYKVIEKLRGQLHKGETLYFEVVGFTESGAPIMDTQDITDPKMKKRYGDMMVYSYGCLPGEAKAYVYRITQADEFGRTVELSWFQVQARCAELNVDTVPVIAQFIVPSNHGEFIDNVVNSLGYEEHPSILSPTHIREGVCIRVEHSAMFDIFKHKSFAFGVLEGYLKDKGDTVDTEEAA
jgi:hypothetical protein